jgi:hypothetical protein
MKCKTGFDLLMGLKNRCLKAQLNAPLYRAAKKDAPRREPPNEPKKPPLRPPNKRRKSPIKEPPEPADPRDPPERKGPPIGDPPSKQCNPNSVPYLLPQPSQHITFRASSRAPALVSDSVSPSSNPVGGKDKKLNTNSLKNPLSFHSALSGTPTVRLV